MAITETLKLADEVSGPAQRMARAVGGLESAVGKAQKANDALAKASGAGIEKAKAAQIKALDAVDRARSKVQAEQKKQSAGEVKAANEAAKAKKRAEGDAAKAKKKAEREAEKAAKKAEALRKKVEAEGKKNSKKLDAKDLLSSFGAGGAFGSGLLTAVAAIGGIAAAVKGATGLVLDLAEAFGEAFIEAVKLRGDSKALMDTLTGGRGGEALALIKQQAIATGQSVGELQDQFKRARDAGATNKQALALGNLRADIIATGRTADEADSAINEMLGKVKSGAKDASKGAAELAVKFGVVGDGVAAVNKQQKTFNGLMNRLKAAPGNFLDALASGSAGKALDELGEKAQKALNKFVDSGGVDRALGKVASAIDTVIAGVELGAALVGPFWEGFKAGIDPVLEALSPIGDALGEAFGGDSAGNMKALEATAKAVGVAFAAGAIAVAAFAAAIGAVLVMTGAVVVGIGLAIAAVAKLGFEAVKFGGDIVLGLVSGIKGGIGKAVAAATELATSVKNAITSALKIGSPSKVFESYGRFTAQGFAQGVESGAPEAAQATRALASPAGIPGQSAPASGATISVGGVTIEYHASGSSTAQDARSLAEQFASFLEGQLLEAGA